MSKSMFSAAAAVMALSGVASALPQASYALNASSIAGALSALGTGYSTPLGTGSPSTIAITRNSTSVSTSTSSSAGSPSSTAGAIKYCPNLNGQIVEGPLEIDYKISCDTNYIGVTIDITLQKKATPTSLQDCLDICSGLDECIAAAYDSDNPTCYLFSSVSEPFYKAGYSFAEKASALATTTSSSGLPAITKGPGNNGSALTNGTAPSNSTTPVESLICPGLDGQVYTDGNGVSYIVECGRNHVGTVIAVNAKRQATTDNPTSILDCAAECDAAADCVGAGFNTVAKTCTLFSEVGAPYYDADVDFFTRIAAVVTTTAPAGASVTPAAVGGAGYTTLANGNVVPLTTSTVYTTSLSTILSCAASVTDCPLRGSVVTETIALYTTICPATAGAAASATAVAKPIACSSCAYAAVTATVYTTTVSTIYSCAATVTNCPLTAGATGPVTVTSMVPGVTTVVNYPMIPATTVATAGSGSGATAGGAVGSGASGKTGLATATPISPAASKTSGLVAFTGAANSLAAKGMGAFGAFVGAAAFLL